MPGLDAPVRFIATPAMQGNSRTVAVVGALLDDRKEALHRLLILLAIGGPITLLLASLACYGVTAGALRPVESMRREAAEVSMRFIATPAMQGNSRTVAVVGALLDDRKEALHRLLILLAIGGPITLLLASLACYGVTAGALRPVESMRREAAEVSMREPGRRLPVPPANDEISRLGNTLNEMLARQELAFERERSFVSDASHELRSPLAILRSEVELALQHGRSEAELRAALASVAEETDRLTHLAEDLLVLARSDRGRLDLAVEDIPAAELLETAGRRFGDRARAGGRALRIDTDGVLLVRADRPRIDQALGNLVENALRYDRGDVLLRAARAGDSVELHVRDAGRGFPEEFIAEAFERFTRADHARSRGGAGLGLARHSAQRARLRRVAQDERQHRVQDDDHRAHHDERAPDDAHRQLGLVLLEQREQRRGTEQHRRQPKTTTPRTCFARSIGASSRGRMSRR